MINGLEGIPGSGKSYEACVFHILVALQRGRMVITNLPLQVEMFAAIDPAFSELIRVKRRPSKILGTWDANRVDDNGNGEAFVLNPDGEMFEPDVSVSVFGHVWDFYCTWKHPETGQGPLFVIDECHVPMPALGTKNEVVEWFKLHRHFNADVLLGTQSFRDMNQPIARLIATLIKVRKADILGKKNSYIRKVHAGYRGAVISTEERDYKPQYFALYKSHTQGNSVAESGATDVKSILVNFNRFKWLWIAFSVVFVAWAFWPADSKPKQRTAKTQPIVEMIEKPEQVLAAVPTGRPPPPGASIDQPTAINEMPEPYLMKGIHLTGKMQMGDKVVYTFTVSNNGIYVTTVASLDMLKVGYIFEPLTDCAGSLKWKTKVRAITCDSPAASVISMPQAQPRPPAAS